MIRLQFVDSKFTILYVFAILYALIRPRLEVELGRVRVRSGRGTYVKIKSLGGVTMWKLNKL